MRTISYILFFLLFVSPVYPLRHVCIDPGHGGPDPGALGLNGAAEPDESDFNLYIANVVNDDLSMVMTTLMTRHTEDFPGFSPRYRAAIANGQRRNDLGVKDMCLTLVSIHNNSSTNSSARGTETYYWRQFGDQALAQNVHNCLWNYLQMFPWADNRGVKQGNFTVLVWTWYPACLVEVAFVSHPGNYPGNPGQWYQLKENLGGFKDYAGYVIADGIRQFWGGLPYPPSYLRILRHYTALIHDSVELTWDPSSTPGVAYNIYRRDHPAPNFNLIASNILETSYLDETTEPGRVYSYAVKAVDSSNHESVRTNILTVQVPPFSSDSPEATAYNNGRKLVFDGDSGAHLVFQSEDKVWYSFSSDFGTTWLPAQVLGDGASPAIALDSQNKPHVVWTGSLGQPDTASGEPQYYGLSYSQELTDRWESTVLYETEESLLGPSFAIDLHDWGRVVFTTDNNALTYGCFDTQAMPDSLENKHFLDESYAGRGSIGTRASDQSIHVVWEKDSLQYRFIDYTRYDPGVGWTIYPEHIGRGCSPSINVVGDCIHVIWEGYVYESPPQGGDQVPPPWWRIRTRYTCDSYWRPIQTIVFLRNMDCFPVMAAGAIASWDGIEVEENWEIWRSVREGDRWTAPENISATETSSLYPHLTFYPGSPAHLITAWTEGDVEPFSIRVKHEELPSRLLLTQGVPHVAHGVITTFSFRQAPNPLRRGTTIYYQFPSTETISVRIHDLAGSLVRVLDEGQRLAGAYSVYWDGTDGKGREVASGVYFVHLKAGTFTRTRKAILLR